MCSLYLVCVIAALFCVANIGLGDTLDSLKEVVGSLCAVNTEGIFAACCAASNNGADITMDNAKDCFFSDLVVRSDNSLGMFAEPHSLPLFM